MAVNKELLRRYVINECSAEERKIVQHWLCIEEQQEPGGFPLNVVETNVKREIWAGITTVTAMSDAWHQSSSKRISRFAYPVAACFLILVFFLLNSYSSLFQRTFSIENISGNAAKRVRLHDLDLIVEPNSRCKISFPLFSKDGTIEFCGAVSVTNISDSRRNLNISAGIANCRYPGTDRIGLQKNQIYLAMTDDNYNMISATTDEIRDGMPRAFSARLTKRFKL